jgi:hypothetical protein
MRRPGLCADRAAANPDEECRETMSRLRNHELRTAEGIRSSGPGVGDIGYRFKEIMRQPMSLQHHHGAVMAI